MGEIEKMTHDQAKMMLILKYGDIYSAYQALIKEKFDRPRQFTREERDIILVYMMEEKWYEV